MYTDGTPLAVEAVGFSAIQQERYAVARRLAAGRKRPAQTEDAVDGEATPEVTLLIGQWLATPAEVVRSAPMLSGGDFDSEDFDEGPY